MYLPQQHGRKNLRDPPTDVRVLIQFTFVVSMSILSFIKINADTVGFHVTQVLAEPWIRYFHDVNRVLNKTFPFKYFFRAELQNTTLVCDAKVFKIKVIDKY